MPAKRRVRLPHVKVVTAKGRTYHYFDTGAKKNGRVVYRRLPEPGTPQFGPAYSDALAARNRRKDPEQVAGELMLADLIRAYESSPKYKKLAAGSQSLYSRYLAVLQAAFATFPAALLERTDVMNLMQSMADTPGAANAMVRATGALYHWARYAEVVPRACKPTENIEMYDIGEHEPWPDELLAAGLADPDPLISVPIALLYFTGQRVGDMCAMTWKNLRNSTIEVTQEKSQGDTTVWVPVHRDLLPFIDRMPRDTLRILTRDGKPEKKRRVSERLKRWADKRGHDIVAHGLRKNAVNTLFEVGCTAAQVISITGQSMQIVEHYAKRRNNVVLAAAAIELWEKAR